VRDLARARRAVGGEVGDEHEELVAAVAGHEVGRAGGALEPARRLAQQLVAGLVAVGVVHLLEVVQVDVEHGDGMARAAALGPGPGRDALRT
jgi:hypothetical protein